MNSKRGGSKPSVAGPSNSLAQGKGPGTQHGYSSENSAANGTNSGIDQLSHGLASTSLTNGGAWRTQVADPRRANGGAANSQPYNRSLVNNAPHTAVAPPLQHGWQREARANAYVTPAQRSGGPYDSVLDAGDQQHQSDVEYEDDDGWQWEARASSYVPPGQRSGGPYDSVLDAGDQQHQSDVEHEDDDGWQWDARASSYVPPGQRSGGSYDSVLDAGDQQHQSDVEHEDDDGWQWEARASSYVPPAQRSGGPTRGRFFLRKFMKFPTTEVHNTADEYDSVLDAGDQQHQSDVEHEDDDYDDFMWEDDHEDAGLREIVSDKDIVWPPMVVVMNTQEMDGNDEKIGMGNEELVDYFSAYTKAVIARHSYEPKGHRGLSILIFESSPVGYWEAENLDKHFTERSIGIWDRHGSLCQLYGYMAREQDVDNFNKHCQGKKKLKFEVKSYQEMVVVPMRQMSEDNQQLVSLKNEVVGEQMHSKALEESLSIMAQKLRRTEEENRIVRQRTKVQHEQNKEEMDSQEQFFKDQISILNQTLEEKEKAFAEKLQEERTKVKLSTVGLTAAEDDKLRKEEADEFIQIQAKGIKKFEAKREKLIKKYLKLENKIKDDLTKLMEYAPTSSEEVRTTDPRVDRWKKSELPQLL